MFAELIREIASSKSDIDQVREDPIREIEPSKPSIDQFGAITIGALVFFIILLAVVIIFRVRAEIRSTKSLVVPSLTNR